MVVTELSNTRSGLPCVFLWLSPNAGPAAADAFRAAAAAAAAAMGLGHGKPKPLTEPIIPASPGNCCRRGQSVSLEREH